MKTGSRQQHVEHSLINSLTIGDPESQSHSYKGLNTLITLRWLSIIGQSLLVWVGIYYWQVELPLQSINLLIALLILSNLFIPFIKDSSINLSGSVLIFDLIILSLMLHFTGGPANPFSVFYLVYVMLAAIMTNTLWTWSTVLVSSIGFACLFWFDQSKSTHAMHMHHGSESFSLHLQGMWLAYTLAAIMIATFVSKLSSLLKHEKEKRIQGEQLIALAALAAGAAHEIGNPLGTIRLITSDLEDYLNKHHPQPELLEDVALINEELQRARKVVNSMASSAGELNGESIQAYHTQSFFEDLLRRFQHSQNIKLELAEELPEKLIWPKEACSQIFVQLIRNAVQASPQDSPILVKVSTETMLITVHIIDQGKGMTNEILSRAGEPFFTTRLNDGMGLGLFIAKSLIERLNGSFVLSSTLDLGTSVQVSLPSSINAQTKPSGFK